MADRNFRYCRTVLTGPCGAHTLRVIDRVGVHCAEKTLNGIWRTSARQVSWRHRGEVVSTAANSSGRRFERLRRDWPLIALSVPGMAFFVVFFYLPIFGNVIAFKDYQPFLGIRDSPWVGFSNFSILFNGDPAFLQALGNTLIILTLQVLVVFPIPIGMAILLDSFLSERIKRAIQSVLYLPHFMSWVIVVAIFQQMLGGGGLMNSLLRTHELGAIDIIGDPSLFKLLITSQVIWKDTGWAMILFLAALSGINPNLYEAAAVDGAAAWRRTWHVTLPGLRGLIVLLLILRLGDALTVGFEQIVLQQPQVGLEASEVLDTYVYNNGILGGQWGISAAVGLVKGLVGVFLVLSANKVAHIFGERGIYQS
ncbi:ABC transporter permease subunit [Kribbella sp. NPDC005582]|uniref:ABC transporter permease n=1 Tax=Kribbella sp. NPDC005582 TaxID=3156893 RepID=UPI0033B77B26